MHLLIGGVYQETFALIDKHNGLNHPKLMQETEVDSKMNQTLPMGVDLHPDNFTRCSIIFIHEIGPYIARMPSSGELIAKCD